MSRHAGPEQPSRRSIAAAADAQDVPHLLAAHAGLVEQFLREQLAELAGFAEAPSTVVEAINYSLLSGGKRLRPALVMEAHRVCRPGLAVDAALPAAAAVELVHCFSLVHDDLPAMDNDDLRRGRPTSHKVFGEAMAILAGDAMVTLAFETLAAGYASAPPVAAALVRELARAAGPIGMIGGQALDMAAQSHGLPPGSPLRELTRLHERKTGALLTASVRMGAIVAEAPAGRLDELTAFGRHLGLAFQIADDLLDVTATSEAIGKGTGKDAVAGKRTYPGMLGVEGAKAAGDHEAQAAIGALERFGPEADGLRALARFTISRTT